MDNERKDNEIKILHKENSLLKKEIVKMESQDKSHEKEIKKYTDKISELEKKISSLKKKLISYEKFINQNLKKPNKDSYYSIDNSNNQKMDSLSYLKKIKINDFNSYKNSPKFYSPKNESLCIEYYKSPTSRNGKNINLINNNIINITYNKKFNKNNNTMKGLMKSKIMKSSKNASSSALNFDIEEGKTLSIKNSRINKNLSKIFSINQSKIKFKNLNQILKLKSKSNYALSPTKEKNSFNENCN
jgi:hypothetical protein